MVPCRSPSSCSCTSWARSPSSVRRSSFPIIASQAQKAPQHGPLRRGPERVHRAPARDPGRDRPGHHGRGADPDPRRRPHVSRPIAGSSIGIVLYLIAIGFAIFVQAKNAEKMVHLTSNMPPGPPPAGAPAGPPPEIAATGKALQQGGMLLTVLIVLIVILMVTKPTVLRPAPRRRGGTMRRSATRSRRCPTSPSSSADLTAPSPGRGPPRRRSAGHRRRGGVPRRGDPRSRWTAAFSTTRRPPRAAQWIVWEAAQALGAHVGQHPGAVRWLGLAARSTGFTVPAINLRAQTFDMARTVFETAAAARRRRGHPRARPERADLHLPAADRLRDRASSPARSRRAGGARSSSRATTTSSTPRSTRPTPRR